MMKNKYTWRTVNFSFSSRQKIDIRAFTVKKYPSV
jgi:hypothetical protein